MNCCTEDTNDGNLNNKPKFRHCTDIIWLWMYTLLAVSMVLIAASAYVYGNPLRLINGYDSFGNVCASDKNEKLGEFNLSGANTVDKPYLFSLDFNDINHSLQICVKKCPDVDLHSMKDIENFYLRTGSLLCRYDMDFNATHDPSSLLNSPIGPCPKLPVLKSLSLFNRCVPEILRGDGIFNLNQSWNFISNVFGNLYASWFRVALLTVFSFLLAAVILLLLYIIPKSAVWIILIFVCIASMALTSVLWWTYFEIKCKLDSDLPEHLLIDDIFNEEAFKWYSILSSIVVLFVLLLAFSLKNKVLFVISLIQESSNCLSELSLLFFLPVVSFFLLFVFYGYWISVVVYLSTVGYPELKDWKPFAIISNSSAHYDVDGLDIRPLNITVDELKSFTAVSYKEVSWFKFMLIIYVIGLILISQLIIACQHMVIADSVANWYFCQVNKNSTSIVTTAVGNLICYHIGSVAVGSLLMTLFRIPRIFLHYLRKIYGQANNSLPDCMKCTCEHYCCEKLIQNINHDAYAVIAMQGVNYCTAARRLVGYFGQIRGAASMICYFEGDNDEGSKKTTLSSSTYKSACCTQGLLHHPKDPFTGNVLMCIRSQTSREKQKNLPIKHRRLLPLPACNFIYIALNHFLKTILIPRLQANWAWKLVVNSTLRVSAINSAGNNIIFLGKYLAVSVTICISIFFFKYDSNLRMSASSTFIVGFFSYFVAHSVLSLFELVNDTLFLCICEDQEINGHECVWKTTLLAKIEHSGLKERSNPPPTEL